MVSEADNESPHNGKVISVVVDTPGWFDPFAEDLVHRLTGSGHSVRFLRKYSDISRGDIAFFLSCLRLVPPEIMAYHDLNLVVHASDLPKGRGFSPLVWQVLDGADQIPITMITMTEAADAGDIVMQRHMHLNGYELNEELRRLMGLQIVEMCHEFSDSVSELSRTPQQGEATWYPRRRPVDSRLNPELSITEQFNLLRVVDNERYPAFFDYRGHRYTLKIEDLGPVSNFREGEK